MRIINDGRKDINQRSRGKDIASNRVLSDEDIYETTKDIPGYLDITPEDFKDLITMPIVMPLTKWPVQLKPVMS